MTEENRTTHEADTSDPTVDEERGAFGSAGWDASDEDGDVVEQDIPKPDPDQDQG